MNQLLLFIIESQDERAEVLPCALRIGVAANHAIHRLRDFDLQPFLAAALFIGAAAAFGEDAFEAFLLRGFEQSNTLPWIVVRVPDDFSGSENVFEDALALCERDSPQIVPIGIHKLEGLTKVRQSRPRGRLP